MLPSKNFLLSVGFKLIDRSGDGVNIYRTLSTCHALFLNLVSYLVGNMGGRDSPRSGSIPQADESWTTVGRGPRNMSVDPKKFQNLKVSAVILFCQIQLSSEKSK